MPTDTFGNVQIEVQPRSISDNVTFTSGTETYRQLGPADTQISPVLQYDTRIPVPSVEYDIPDNIITDSTEFTVGLKFNVTPYQICLLYTSPSPRD